MSNFNFTSQVCTSRSQSEKLLALGLKKETADMMYCKTAYGESITVKDDDYLEHLDSPAWSLHRLIEIYDKTCIFWSDCFDNPYEAMISRIANKIKWGELNKEYLEENE